MEVLDISTGASISYCTTWIQTLPVGMSRGFQDVMSEGTKLLQLLEVLDDFGKVQAFETHTLPDNRRLVPARPLPPPQ